MSPVDAEESLFSMLPRDVALCSTSQLCTEHNLLEVTLSVKNRETKASVISMSLTENFLPKDHRCMLSKQSTPGETSTLHGIHKAM